MYCSSCGAHVHESDLFCSTCGHALYPLNSDGEPAQSPKPYKFSASPAMSIVESFKSVFSKFATFTGRARRSEYWWFTGVTSVVHFVCAVMVCIYLLLVTSEMEGVLDDISASSNLHSLIGWAIVWGVYFLVLLLPSLSVTVRRLHDTGRSGWWFLMMFIPEVGWVFVVVLSLLDSNRGDNKYGPSPKYIKE